MRKIFLILAFIPLLINAQVTKKDKTKKNVAIGISFSPDYNYRKLKNNDGSSSSDFVINSRNEQEKGKFSVTTGLTLIARLSKKLELQTGLLYSDKGHRIPKHALDYAPRPGEPTHIKSQTSFNYLDIPLKLNFISGSGHIKFIAGAGLTVNILLNESELVTLFYGDGSEKELRQSDQFEYKKFNLSSVISAGVEFKLTENFFLRTEPTFRYGLLKIIDLPVTAYLWNVGLNVGVYYKLK